MSGTVVLQCTCTHSYQDEIYGRGMRLHNLMTKDGKTRARGRCTVCGTEHDVSYVAIQSVEKGEDK